MSHFPIDELRRDGELVEHAERDGAAAGLGGVGAALEEKGFDAAGGEGFGGGGAGGTTAYDGGAKLAAGDGWVGGFSGDDEGRGWF